MIYEHRTYTLLAGKLPEWLEHFGHDTVPLFKKYGAGLMGVWRTAIGTSNEALYILSFENLSHREKVWQAIRQDDLFIKSVVQGPPRVEKVVNKIARATDYSPAKVTQPAGEKWVYVHRTHNVVPGKMQEFHEFRKKSLPIWEKHGMHIVSYLQTTIGESNEVISITAFNGPDGQDEVNDAIHRDEAFQALARERRGSITDVRTVTTILQATNYSPLQ